MFIPNQESLNNNSLIVLVNRSDFFLISTRSCGSHSWQLLKSPICWRVQFGQIDFLYYFPYKLLFGRTKDSLTGFLDV